MSSETSVAAQHLSSPYVGPREFRRDQQLPNRQEHASAVRDLIASERVVLLHAPSGAGITSLIEAGVVAKFADEELIPTGRTRVSVPAPTGEAGEIHNRYAFSVGTCLFEELQERPALEHMSLVEMISEWTDICKPDGLPILIIDQFEEILTLDPIDWKGQGVFFDELGEVVDERKAFLLLAMREDFIGGLDRFMRVPALSHVRFRLDYLSWEEARQAIQIPARQRNVTFAEDAADHLLSTLALESNEHAGDELSGRHAPYIQPFQLQLACGQIWGETRKRHGDNFTRIDIDDVKASGNIKSALTRYYGEAVGDTANKTGIRESDIRDWFEDELIIVGNGPGQQYIRSQTQEPPRAGDDEARRNVIAQLEDAYLIESIGRGGSIWYELTHDRLITAVMESNAAWRRTALDPWQIQARRWKAGGRDPDFLLGQRGIQSLPVFRSNCSDTEKAFIKESQRKVAEDRGLERTLRSWTRAKAFATAEAVVLVLLLAALIACWMHR